MSDMKAAFFHLFAYGSLASADARPAADLLAGCEQVGRASVRGTLYDLGEYPALLLSGATEVAGVIWRCPADRLPLLDAYEAVEDGLFRRVGVRAGDYACWVYVAGPRLGLRLTPEARLDHNDRKGKPWPSTEE
jgi:gamma-glutamylcyclotransferase (GGCT)/AIG2-like uncharacterized protein YtfP